jgi:hypothetical protein
MGRNRKKQKGRKEKGRFNYFEKDSNKQRFKMELKQTKIMLQHECNNKLL